MSCDARIRPMRPVNDIELDCSEEGEHDSHRASLKDYAFAGSETTIVWTEEDRRNFHGEWPGSCLMTDGCILPDNHDGRCAQ